MECVNLAKMKNAFPVLHLISVWNAKKDFMKKMVNAKTVINTIIFSVKDAKLEVYVKNVLLVTDYNQMKEYALNASKWVVAVLVMNQPVLVAFLDTIWIPLDFVRAVLIRVSTVKNVHLQIYVQNVIVILQF